MTQENIPLQLNEEIKPIIGYEVLYSITSFGRVWSYEKIAKHNGRIYKANFRKAYKDSAGYLFLDFYIKGERRNNWIHILVAKHFIPNPLNLPQVNHKDGNKQNNYAGTAAKKYTDGNLEWCNNQENQNHASKNGLRKFKHHSGYYGVSYYKNKRHKNKPWRAYTTVNKRFIYIGGFKTEIGAAQAYNNYVVKQGLNRLLNEFR